MDVNRVQFLITHPDSSKSLQDYYLLHEMVVRYPYAQPLQLLFLKIISELKPMLLREEIENRVVFLTDRKALFQCLNRQYLQWIKLQKQVSMPQSATDPTVDSAFHLIDDFLLQSQDEPFPEQIEDLIPQVEDTPLADYTQMLLEQPDLTPSSSSSDTIIDQFIELNAIEPISLPISELSAQQTEPFKADSSSESLMHHDAFLTESLAKIYIKQKKYAKALEIIKKLRLKYPEKNVYFADQIRFLETIITNIKTE